MSSSSPIFKPEDFNPKPSICYFGLVQIKGQIKNFGILTEDRRRHVYILGKTGMGKSTLLQNMIIQDIYNGHGACFLDPHGDSAEYILDKIPPKRHKDVVYFNPSDTDYPFGFNMLDTQNGEEPFLVASGMMAVFRRIWEGMWSARMEYILSNTLLALLETPNTTLLGVVKILTDKSYRKKIVGRVKNPLVKNFWTREFVTFNDKYRQEAISPILNKIGQFFSTGLNRNILGQAKSTINFREIMDSKKIFIANLSKGKLGEDNSSMLGSFIVTKLQLTAMSRVNLAESQREDFFMYVDEFQSFTTDSFSTILSEARKYKLNLTIAHQYISQLEESGSQKIRGAIFGNTGTIISFRTGSEDAETLAKEFEPNIKTSQMVSLNKAQIALKMSISGKASSPFIASTMPPAFDHIGGNTEAVVDISRQTWGTPKSLVEASIDLWMQSQIPSLDLADYDNYKKIQEYINNTNSSQDPSLQTSNLQTSGANASTIPNNLPNNLPNSSNDSNNSQNKLAELKNHLQELKSQVKLKSKNLKTFNLNLESNRVNPSQNLKLKPSAGPVSSASLSSSSLEVEDPGFALP